MYGETHLFCSTSSQVLIPITLGGAIFVLVQKSASKVLKTRYFANFLGQWGGVTNDKVFLTRSCDTCQFAKSSLVKAYFLNLNTCQDLPIRTELCFLQGNDAHCAVL